MHTATREETLFIQRVIFFFIVPLMICIVLTLKLSSQNEKAVDAIEVLQKTLINDMKRFGTLPTMRKVSREKEELTTMQEYYSSIKTYATLNVINAPEEEIEKGVYFKKQLYLAYKALKNIAAQHDVTMPDSLGFGEALPSEKEVPELLRKLETVNTVMSIILQQGIDAVTVIKLLDNQSYTDDANNEIPAKEILIRIDVTCHSQALMKVMYEIGSQKPFIVIKDISVKAVKDRMLEANFIFSRLINE